MTVEEILSKLDYILKKFNELEKIPREHLAFDIKIQVIRNEVEALRNAVENAFHEKDVAIADLKKAIEIYKEAH